MVCISKRFQSFQSGSDGSKPLRPPPPPPCCRCSFHLHPGKGAYLPIISVSMSAVQSWSRLFGLSILITLFSPTNSFNLHHYGWAILTQSLHSGAPLRNTISLCWPSCRSSKYYCLSVFCFYPFFIYAFPLEVFICGLTAGLETKALSKSKLFTPVICPIQEKSENQCTSQLKSLIDQVSMQQEKIVALEGTNTSNLHLHMIFLDAKTQIKHVNEFTQIQYFQDTIGCNV